MSMSLTAQHIERFKHAEQDCSLWSPERACSALIPLQAWPAQAARLQLLQSSHWTHSAWLLPRTDAWRESPQPAVHCCSTCIVMQNVPVDAQARLEEGLESGLADLPLDLLSAVARLSSSEADALQASLR